MCLIGWPSYVIDKPLLKSFCIQRNSENKCWSILWATEEHEGLMQSYMLTVFQNVCNLVTLIRGSWTLWQWNAVLVYHELLSSSKLWSVLTAWNEAAYCLKFALQYNLLLKFKTNLIKIFVHNGVSVRDRRKSVMRCRQFADDADVVNWLLVILVQEN